MNLIQDKWYILFYTLLAFLITIYSYSLSPAAVNTYPANGWQTSTPEEQGMQSQVLVNMIEEIKMKGYNIDIEIPIAELLKSIQVFLPVL